jgi:hypothetical protein
MMGKPMQKTFSSHIWLAMRVTLMAIMVLFLPHEQAFADTIRCTVPGAVLDQRDRWVAPSYEFNFDPETYQAKVSDPVSLNYAGRSMNVDAGSSTNSKFVFVWKFPVTNAGGQVETMMYRAVIFRKSSEFLVRAVANTYWIKDSEGRGVCVFGQ